ncbi:fibronectin type III domain-containing protein [Aeromicrobium wangtongii]|uniref:Fibronectin type III domain-containing protein n=1 Tax=Aeromicrobium wangtongii TaxID=2969247 RepID=A0ABY5M2E2_9ACTN|nr:fibronectin type III domain-containing protein [Aeromicrobium wangtongii]MCD9198344.1 fibronectin type III domain-containing protein [Aeromicrobium wangtongii]UUP12375.1 fibronectin type III domain-containing protein [Aeromicrobium wangtongii]
MLSPKTRVLLCLVLPTLLLAPVLTITPASADDLDHVSTATGTPELVTVNEPSLPPGVSLDDPTDTTSLLKKAGVDGEPVTKDGTPKRSLARAAATYFPAGASVIPGYGGHVAPACAGDGTDGRRVRVMYVRETSDPSRLTALRGSFLNELAQVDDLFAYASSAPGESRRVRWYSDPNCQPTIDEVVVAVGVLSVGGSAGHTALTNALNKAGYTNNMHKYIVFAEGNRIGGSTCGLGNFYQDVRPGAENYNNGGGNTSPTVARIDTVCWFSNASSATTTHELMHTLGGVLQSAPDATLYGHCHDARDPMCYDDGSGMPMRSVCTQTGAALQLDCNKDDYFNIAPASGTYLANNWNVANSLFLTKVAFGTDPWSSAALTVDPPVVTTGQDATLLVAGTPAGTTAAFSVSNDKCTVVPAGSSADGIRGTLNCSARAVPGNPDTTTVVVTAALSHPDYPTSSRSLNVTVKRAAPPMVAVAGGPEVRTNVPYTIRATSAATGLSWGWTASDSRCQLDGAATPVLTITCPDASAGRLLELSVTATAPDGQSYTAYADVDVIAQYSSPELDLLGPRDVKTGNEYIYTADLTSADPADPVTYSWKDEHIEAGREYESTIVGPTDQRTVKLKPIQNGERRLTVTVTVGSHTLSSQLFYLATTDYVVTVTSSHNTAMSGTPVVFDATATDTFRTNFSWSLNPKAESGGCRISSEMTPEDPHHSAVSVTCPAGFSGPVTATVTGTGKSGQVEASGSSTVQFAAVPFSVAFLQTPTGKVGNGKAGTFTVTSTVPAQFHWVPTRPECTVGNPGSLSETQMTATVTCPVTVHGNVGLTVVATEIDPVAGDGKGRTRTATASMEVDKAPPPPAAVTGVEVVAYDPTTISLRWNPSAGAESYVVRYSTRSDGSYYMTTTVAGGASTTLTGLSPGITHYVSIVAIRGGVASDPTGWWPVTTPLVMTPLPPRRTPSTPAPFVAKPSGVKMKAHTKTTITPKWSRPAGAKKFIVYYGTKANGKGAKSKTVGNKAAVKLTRLKKNTRYYVRVIAVSAAGKKSAYSKQVSMKTKAK